MHKTQVQSDRINADVFNPFGLEFCRDNLSYHGDRFGSTFILLQVDIQLCQHHLLKMLSFLPLYTFCSFVENQVFIGLWVNIRVFYSIPYVNFSVVMPIPSCFQYCSSVIEFEVRDGNACRSSFII